jgi:hypothetical protein
MFAHNSVNLLNLVYRNLSKCLGGWEESSNLESLKTDILIPSTAKLFDERNQRIGYLESSQNMNNLRNR